MLDQIALQALMQTVIVVGMAPALDSPSYKMRELAQQQMERMPIIFAAGGVIALTKHSSLEVSTRAERWMDKWESVWVQSVTADTKWMDDFISADPADKPWKKLKEMENNKGKMWTWAVTTIFNKKFQEKFPNSYPIYVPPKWQDMMDDALSTHLFWAHRAKTWD